MLKQYFLKRTKRFQRITAVMAIPIVACIGTYLIIFSHAATSYSSINPDRGSLTGVATIKTDSTASDGKYVQFGTPSSGTPAFRVGLDMRIWESNDTSVAGVVNPKLVRFELNTSEANTNSSVGTTWVNFYSGLGAFPQPLVNFTGVPSNSTVDQVAAWAKTQAGKIKLIEWGNEDSYNNTDKYHDQNGSSTYEARALAYGKSVQRLGQDLAGSGVGVIAQADDGDSGSPDWVDHMFAAVAAPDNLQNYVTGWTLHPYGPTYMTRINRLLSQVGNHTAGVVKPIYITEWGIPTDNGRTLNSTNYGFPANMTYQQSADALNSFVSTIAASGKVAEYTIYQSSDQSASGADNGVEHYFGVVQADGSTPKGAYTTAAINILKTY